MPHRPEDIVPGNNHPHVFSWGKEAQKDLYPFKDKQIGDEATERDCQK